ncbi:MAG: glutamate-5-semialdehyde dehydrogenase [Lachnospiraceae bacterium]|nr:glutamate-5-semialdehyde dehydrogenase [Lachnospiraceae bacterium]
MYLETLGENAVKAKYTISLLEEKKRNDILLKIADALIKNSAFIIEQNKIDYDKGVSENMKAGLLDRLMLNEQRIEGISEGIRQVAALEDPLNRVLSEKTMANGMNIKKISVPLGVIGIIYESRPNVTADAFSLTFKSGNVCILKGGSDAINSNIAIVKVIRDVLKEENVDENAVQLIEKTDRETAAAFMKLNDYVDVLIPRGSANLIKAVVNNSTIPVIETGSGNCHVYVDKDADIDMAVNIIFNAKTQRIGVCNACESLVVHKDIKEALLPKLAAKLKEKDVEIRGDKCTKDVIDCVDATEEDFGKEYLDYIISIKTVSDVDEAIAHINKYNTGHSDCIVTNNDETADKFLKGVDAACVYRNVSTRFTDGFEFGLGAEIGISTQKLHARGPMGLNELTSYKYIITGNGQTRG